VVGGLVASTFLTLFVVPALYALLNRDAAAEAIPAQ
jgi:Cu/Ag efflux pump CusA